MGLLTLLDSHYSRNRKGSAGLGDNHVFSASLSSTLVGETSLGDTLKHDNALSQEQVGNTNLEGAPSTRLELHDTSPK